MKPNLKQADCADFYVKVASAARMSLVAISMMKMMKTKAIKVARQFNRNPDHRLRINHP